ncbi:TetR/AcrR family transcriptional regulator [Cohnella boryungensis]|uniref:TetR/AcrR family transcriptional regulator n=1 Tax=Cohnella boryungensis TaxID=768479 RepID=A0ABV8S3T6_9BACL
MNRIDRRQARTRQLLLQAFLGLIQEKGIDSVTVTDIANRADVNRGTFYLHYRDVPDMMEKIVEDLYGRFSRLVTRLDPRELIQYADKKEPYPKIVDIFEEARLHADIMKVLFGPKGDLSFALRFKNLLTNNLFNKMEFNFPEDGPRLVPRDFLVAYIASANFGLFLHWVEGGFKETPYQMGLIITQLSNHGPLITSGIRNKLPSTK